MRITSRSDRSSRSIAWCMIESVVFSVCITPFGSPVVPDVNTTSCTAFTAVPAGAPPARRGRVGERRERGRTGGPVAPHHEDVLETRELGAQRGQHAGVLEAAEGGRHHHDRRLQQPQHEPELAGPVGGRDRIDHRAQAQGSQEDGHRLAPVGELDRDDAPSLDNRGGRARRPRDPPTARAPPTWCVPSGLPVRSWWDGHGPSGRDSPRGSRYARIRSSPGSARR